MTHWLRNDGGREKAGFVGETRDCVTRAIAIATGRSYQRVYDDLYEAMIDAGMNMSPRNGVPRKIYQPYLESLGWKWKAAMGIGTGCKMHLKADELPTGPIVARISRHLCAVVDGVVHDTHDPSRDGKRCVYGYFYKVIEIRYNPEEEEA